MVLNRSGFSYNPNNWKTEPFKIFMLLSGFQMVFNKMAAICPDFKWPGFKISDPIQNPDHLQTNLFFDHFKYGRVRISDPH